MSTTRDLLVCALLLSTAACGGSETQTQVTHTFDPIAVGVGGEILDVCQSWVLDNDEPLYVEAIAQANEGGWHHSNWFFVPEGTYMPNTDVEGPDAAEAGTWPCSARDFRERTAASLGGVLFAQSTQTDAEEQRFPSGAALMIPPRSVIIGGVHLVNLRPTSINSSIALTLSAVPPESVTTSLQLVNFSNGSLAIPPQQESRFSMTCDMGAVYEATFDETRDYNIYYVLPHYHEWGNYFRLSFVDDDGNATTVFETRGRAGDALGSVIDPPINSAGARYLRTECGYFNDTDNTLTWGFGGKEMCEMLVYIDGGLKIAGGSQGAAVSTGMLDGREQFETMCGPLVGVTDAGSSGEVNACGAGNSFLAGGSTATQTITCDIIGVLTMEIEAQVAAIPRNAVEAGATVDIEFSGVANVADEVAMTLSTFAGGNPIRFTNARSRLAFTGGVASAEDVVLGLSDVPCDADYSQGSVPIVTDSATARVVVADEADEITLELAEFTLETTTPSPTYLSTVEIPDDVTAPIQVLCTAPEATLRIPVGQ